MSFFTIKFEEDKVIMIDQRKLPLKTEYFIAEDYKDVIFAIKEMVVRGAPAIGIAAAMGIALYVEKENDLNKILSDFDNICKEFESSRPTAVNLFWAIDRIKKVFNNFKNSGIYDLKEKLKEEANKILLEDIEINKKIGEFGNKVVPENANILTHCNAGALATGGYGTALGVVRSAFFSGKKIHVFVDETRPVLQGARLTAWELLTENIPCTLISDNMAGFLMKRGKIDFIVVGADRIAANGDTANKIGTYSLSVLAKEHNLPFYIAAPFSTFDLSIKTGEEIPIEERNEKEIKYVFDTQIAPEDINVFNPAFDVTPAENITGIITEKGIIEKPNLAKIKKFF